MTYTIDPSNGADDTFGTSAAASGTNSRRIVDGIAVDTIVNIDGCQLNLSRAAGEGTSSSGDQLPATGGDGAIVWDNATTGENRFRRADQDDGADIFHFCGGNTVSGGDGSDMLWDGAGEDAIIGGTGADFIYALEEDDTF